MRIKEKVVSIFEKNGKFSIKIWVYELGSWLVFDGFKTRKIARAFLNDKEEMQNVKKLIAKTVKHYGEIDSAKKKAKEASICDTEKPKKIKGRRLCLPNS
ncbi:MAG TPA: hypothetical protein DDY21_00070 [Candidatus Moranbacteria bacterium]|nr:hypothetical protein [Candidatus Moranbacteria bacterium]